MATWDLSKTKHHVLICNGSSCMRKGGEEVTQAIRNEIASAGADHFIHTSRTRCNGRCQDACVVIVYPEGVWYKDMTTEHAEKMVHDHLIGGSQLAEQIGLSYYDESFQPTPNTAKGKLKKEVLVKK